MQNTLILQLFHWRFWLRCFRNFLRKDGLDAVTVLAYTSLVGMVPFFGVLVSILSLVDIFKINADKVIGQVLAHVLPSTSPLIEQYLIEFSSHASHLKGLGVVFIFLTSLLMLWSIDNKINAMWHKSIQRRFWVSLLRYLSVALVGPLLLMASFALSSALPALSLGLLDENSLSWLLSLNWIMNFFGFWFLYHYVPVAKISWQASLLGAGVVTLILSLMKEAFVLYVQWFPSYDLIYGAFAAVPLFLLWICLVWMVIILGASAVYELGIILACHTRARCSRD